jgi:glutamate racemase
MAVNGTVVLGCTHFPLLREELAAVLPDGTRLVDSGAAIARRVAWLIANQENTLSTEDDVAYATKTNSDTEALLPVLHRMGFSELRELSI